MFYLNPFCYIYIYDLISYYHIHSYTVHWHLLILLSLSLWLVYYVSFYHYPCGLPVCWSLVQLVYCGCFVNIFLSFISLPLGFTSSLLACSVSLLSLWFTEITIPLSVSPCGSLSYYPGQCYLAPWVLAFSLILSPKYHSGVRRQMLATGETIGVFG